MNYNYIVLYISTLLLPFFKSNIINKEFLKNNLLIFLDLFKTIKPL